MKSSNYKNSHIGHAQISECANVKVRNILHVLYKNICSKICKYITAPTLFAVETLLFRVCNYK